MATFLREEGLQPPRVQTQEGERQNAKNNRIFTEEHFQTRKLLFVGQMKSCVLEIQFENVHSRRPQIKNHWSQYFLFNPHISQFYDPDIDHFTMVLVIVHLNVNHRHNTHDHHDISPIF